MAASEDPFYTRRRIDKMTDDRLEAIEDAQKSTNTKIDRLEARLNWIAGGLAVLSIVLNLFGAQLVDALSK